MKFENLIITVAIIVSLIIAQADISKADTEVWEYEVTVKPAYIQKIKKNIKLNHRNRDRRLTPTRLKNQISTKITRQFKNIGASLEAKNNSGTYTVESTFALEKLPFAKSIVAVSHSSYMGSETKETYEKPEQNFNTRSIDPCPSVQDSTECNGFTNDPIGSWALSPNTGMAVNEGWKQSKGEGVIVAILSTGANLTHPDLINNLWSDTSTAFAPGESIHGFNAYANTPPTDSSDTGTALAGVVGAQANNSIGTAGVAYNSKLMIIKGFDEVTLDRDKIEASIRYVLKKRQQGHNIRVLLAPNFYLGNSPGPSPVFLDLAEQLNDAGILLVSNAPKFNNDSSLNIDGGYNGFQYFPFNYDTGNILITSSYTHGNFQTTFPAPVYTTPQNIGPNTIHLSTPGERVYTTDGSSYTFWTGGSISAANAAGAAAVIFSKVPSLNPTQVLAALVNNTRSYPSSFSGKTISFGALDLGLAMGAVVPEEPGNGDFNGDGCVDGGDFLYWQRNIGQSVIPGTGADASGNGLVDSDDLTIWKEGFGAGC